MIRYPPLTPSFSPFLSSIFLFSSPSFSFPLHLISFLCHSLCSFSSIPFLTLSCLCFHLFYYLFFFPHLPSPFFILCLTLFPLPSFFLLPFLISFFQVSPFLFSFSSHLPSFQSLPYAFSSFIIFPPLPFINFLSLPRFLLLSLFILLPLFFSLTFCSVFVVCLFLFHHLSSTSIHFLLPSPSILL